MFPEPWLEARERALSTAMEEEFRLLVRLMDTGGSLLGRIQRLARESVELRGEANAWAPLMVFIMEESVGYLFKLEVHECRAAV
jgi:hypothetical protein